MTKNDRLKYSTYITIAMNPCITKSQWRVLFISSDSKIVSIVIC